MGHMVAKDVYGALGDKIDSLTVRTPQTEAFHAMLRELYSPEEAELMGLVNEFHPLPELRREFLVLPTHTLVQAFQTRPARKDATTSRGRSTPSQRTTKWKISTGRHIRDTGCPS